MPLLLIHDPCRVHHGSVRSESIGLVLIYCAVRLATSACFCAVEMHIHILMTSDMMTERVIDSRYSCSRACQCAWLEPGVVISIRDDSWD